MLNCSRPTRWLTFRTLPSSGLRRSRLSTSGENSRKKSLARCSASTKARPAASSAAIGTRSIHALAPGLTPRSVLEKFAAMQMIDLHLPTTDGRELLLTRYTEPEPELSLLLNKLKLELPAQPPPKITAAPAPPSPL
jgi:hypothetical protein